MTNILFIVFQFPPLNAGGVHRPLRMVNNLKSFGFNPVVLTIDAEKVYEKQKLDFTLSEKISPAVQIIRTDFNSKKFRRKFIESGYSFTADPVFIDWKAEAKKKINEAFSNHNFKAVFVTLPPFSLGALGIWVKQQYKVPLIVDMRDAWSNWITSPYASYLHYLNIKRLERNLLKAADAILVTSQQTINDFRNLHKEVPAGNFHFVPNGFEDYLTGSYTSLDKSKEKIKIGYVGSFYYNPASQKLLHSPWYKKKPYQYLQYAPRVEDWLYRSPYFFFKALASLFAKYPDYKNRIQLVFAGTEPSWFSQMIEQFGLAAVLDHRGKISQKASLELQKECDLLFITSAKVVGGCDYSIAGKTFEYFSMRKPILGFVCEGAQKWVLENSGLAVIADPDDTLKATLILKDLIDGKIHLKPEFEFINQFKMESIMEKLSTILKSVIKND